MHRLQPLQAPITARDGSGSDVRDHTAGADCIAADALALIRPRGRASKPDQRMLRDGVGDSCGTTAKTADGCDVDNRTCAPRHH